MKRCLADVNLLLPLLARAHPHHRAALGWFDGLQAGEAAACRLAQLAVVRLLGNPSVMGTRAMTAFSAWKLVGELLEDERMDFVPEPEPLETILPRLLRYAVPANKLVNDAYLAAFSIAGNMRLATFDTGFRQFPEVDLDLLDT